MLQVATASFAMTRCALPIGASWVLAFSTFSFLAFATAFSMMKPVLKLIEHLLKATAEGLNGLMLIHHHRKFLREHQLCFRTIVVQGDEVFKPIFFFFIKLTTCRGGCLIIPVGVITLLIEVGVASPTTRVVRMWCLMLRIIKLITKHLLNCQL